MLSVSKGEGETQLSDRWTPPLWSIDIFGLYVNALAGLEIFHLFPSVLGPADATSITLSSPPPLTVSQTHAPPVKTTCQLLTLDPSEPPAALLSSRYHKVSLWVPYWIVNATPLPLTLQQYFHPSMLAATAGATGGGSGMYEAIGGNPLFSAGDNDDDGNSASEARAQQLRLTPAAAEAAGGARKYAATVIAAAAASAVSAAAAAGLASTSASAKTNPSALSRSPEKDAVGHAVATKLGEGAAAAVGLLPPAKKQPRTQGLKFLVEEEDRETEEKEEKGADEWGREEEGGGLSGAEGSEARPTGRGDVEEDVVL